MGKNSDYFVLSRSSCELLLLIPDKQLGRAFKAALSYFSNGSDFVSDDDLEKLAFAVIKQDIDRTARKDSIHGRNSKEYKRWRNLVFERDNYTCQMCGKRGGKLNAHHIVRFRKSIEKRVDVSNGITLCEDCHRRLHRKEGR